MDEPVMTLDLPPSYESVVANGNSTQHVYLTPGAPSEQHAPG